MTTIQGYREIKARETISLFSYKNIQFEVAGERKKQHKLLLHIGFSKKLLS